MYLCLKKYDWYAYYQNKHFQPQNLAFAYVKILLMSYTSVANIQGMNYCR